MIRFLAVLTLSAVPWAAWAAPAVLAPSAEMDPASAAALSQSSRLIEENRYCEALPYLEDLAIDLPDNADVFSMLGYVYRKMDDLEYSGEHYARALSIDPNHLGALEYQGELFLQRGDVDGALANLSRLETLCGSCAEKQQLAAAVNAWQAR